MRANRVYLLLPLLFCSCKKATPVLFELLPAARTGIDFSNTLSEGDSLNILNYVYYYNGGGVGIADINNDGLEDIFFTGNETSCRLYLNKGGLQFEDITQSAGIRTTQWCTGVALADVNADGWTDIYVCTAGYLQPERRHNLLFINQGKPGTPAFTETAAAYGVADTGYSTQAAFFDYDRDGDLDLYVLNHANERETLNTPLPKKTRGEGASNDRLYRNNGNQTFTDVTREAGITTEGYGLGIAVSDVDGDGWPDIYVSNDFIYNDLLYINNQGKSFSNQIARYLEHQSYNGMGCDWADYNNDARPDLLVVDMLPETDSQQKTMAGAMNWDKWQLIAQAGYEPQYMRNTLQVAVDGGRWTVDGGRWTVVSRQGTGSESNEQSGKRSQNVKPSTSLPRVPSIVHRPPSTVHRPPSTVYRPPSTVYRPPSTVYRPPSTVYRPPSTVYRPPSTVYSEIGQLAGVAATDWSWAPLFADFDNDGWKDLFITNGYLRDITDKDFIQASNNLSMFQSPDAANRDLLPKIRQLEGKRLPNRIFQNMRDLTFLPQPAAWGMTQPSCSNGAAYADLDGDGDLDLVVNNINEAAFVLENKTDKLLNNNYLNLKLEGLSGNGSGIGATVSVVVGGQRQYVEQYLSRGFMSSVTDVLHFGLGTKTSIDTLEVRWSDGRRQVLTNLATQQTLTLKQANARAIAPEAQPLPVTLLKDVTGAVHLDFNHREELFNDFQFQPLLPHGLSRNGPPIATGDLNGDGWDDVYTGAGKGQAGQLFFQTAGGHFTSATLPDGQESEDTGAVIFDANGDGRNDLYVVSGSNEWAPDDPAYQDRLYLNDGNGRLHRAKDALPDLRSPGACVAAADMDGDGDTDLFVGGSAEPRNYPLPARSYVLRNDGGRFTDVTDRVAPGLKNPGIVAAAQWADLDRDGWPDLVLTGEWMPVTVYMNKQGNLVDATAAFGLAENSGWWNSLCIHDLNGDGHPDIAAGNLGLNTKYRASEQHPMRVYAGDFDHNGRLDALICRWAEGKEKPVHQRDEVLAQIIGLSKKYPSYARYAAASVQEMLGPNALEAAYVRKTQHFESTCFLYQNGRFVAHPLPLLAQIAPVNALISRDFNGDRHPDLLLIGNDVSPNVATGQYDAGKGLLLLGDGTGQFQALEAGQSGFYVQGVGKSLATVRMKSGKSLLLAGVNGGRIRVFETSGPLNIPAGNIPITPRATGAGKLLLRR